MSALTIRLPNSVHQKIKELAGLKAESASGDRGAFERRLNRRARFACRRGDAAVAVPLLGKDKT